MEEAIDKSCLTCEYGRWFFCDKTGSERYHHIFAEYEDQEHYCEMWESLYAGSVGQRVEEILRMKRMEQECQERIQFLLVHDLTNDERKELEDSVIERVSAE